MSSDHDASDGSIRPMDAESVQRIVAGQAVTDLASAVKELVDNSLDAGSRGINIRLFNQGLDILEVSDDGCGVSPDSRPLLAQAHATSKIRSFDDIYSSATSLGFRGEALFCLANLSEKLIVATRTHDEPVGQQMEFGHDGRLNSEKTVAVPRKVGTTVAVVKLLNSLPVRRADMERRIAQHRNKMMKVLEGYAIFNVGVRINLMDVVNRKENTLLATAANSRTLEQNISSILGSKFLASVAPISINLSRVFEAESSSNGTWKLEGYLSRAPSRTNCNKNTRPGQQFFSINGRPVELPKVARVIAEVWRVHDAKKKFSCILALTLPNQQYDVNLAPEKRQVLLTNEAAICQAIRQGVTEFWAGQTDGHFASGACQPLAAKRSSSGALKPLPPKIDNMESLASLQESNRKRARELHGILKRVQPQRNSGRDLEDDRERDGQCGGDETSKRAHIWRFKEEQKAQRALNACQGDVGCQYGEEHPGLQVQAEREDSPLRVRRRGGFIHDISTAKQWERPLAVDANSKILPRTEDVDGDEELRKHMEAAQPAEKRQCTGLRRPTSASPVPVAERLRSMQEAADGAAKAATEAEQEHGSSRRVTLSLNNELSEEHPASHLSLSVESFASVNEQVKNRSKGSARVHKAAVKLSDEDACDEEKLVWTQAQARFNQGEEALPENESGVLMRSSP